MLKIFGACSQQVKHEFEYQIGLNCQRNIHVKYGWKCLTNWIELLGIKQLVKLLNDVQYGNVLLQKKRDTELGLVTLANILDSNEARTFRIQNCSNFKIMVKNDYFPSTIFLLLLYRCSFFLAYATEFLYTDSIYGIGFIWNTNRWKEKVFYNHSIQLI